MNTEDMVHTYNGVISQLQKKRMKYAICSNMDTIRNYYTELSQKEKDKYHMTSLICGI